MKFSLDTYRAKCNLVLFLSTVGIIVLPFLNLLRLDIPTMRFYFLSTVLWVDEFYLIFLIFMTILWLIIGFSMIYGRVWCGWMCPQTVIIKVVRWFEKWAGRLLRVKRKSGLARRAAQQGLVALATAGLSLIIGFNLVAYFVDPYRMLANLANWEMHHIVVKVIIAIAVVIFIDAMWWRETFCTRACPYGMLQLLVTDGRTQIMRYHTERADECLDCDACVRGCTMGIDIRESPHQTECVYCGDCADACTRVLAHKNKPGLITYSWGEYTSRDKWYEKIGFVDAKRWAILGVAVAFALVPLFLINARQPLRMQAHGDRSTLYRQELDGRIYNDYTVRISNRSMEDGVFEIVCSGGGDEPVDCRLHLEENPLPLDSRETRTFKLAVSSGPEALRPGPNRLELSLVRVDDEQVRSDAEIAFFMPEDFEGLDALVSGAEGEP